ncbi:MAG: cyclase family protein [Oscillospiraceae bacterium]|nr:cyclase family protein [Oscillospiraceae bacterium]
MRIRACPEAAGRAMIEGADGAAVGALRWEETPGDAPLVHMEMLPPYQGRGLSRFAGEAALAFLREILPGDGLRAVVDPNDARALRFCRAFGFEIVGYRAGQFYLYCDERPWVDATRMLDAGIYVYPEDPPYSRTLFRAQADFGWNISLLSMNVHTGTHIDAPLHLGYPGDTESWGLHRMNGMVQLLDWGAEGAAAIRCPRVLVRNGGAGFSLSGARAMLAAGVTLLGTDALSVGTREEEKAVHELLLTGGVLLLENAAIEGLEVGFYQMRCLPLKLAGSDGAPVRVLLRKESA